MLTALRNTMLILRNMCLIGLTSTLSACTSEIPASQAFISTSDGQNREISFEFVRADEVRQLTQHDKFYIAIGPCAERSEVRFYPADLIAKNIPERTASFSFLLDSDLSGTDLVSQCAYIKTTGYSVRRLETSFAQIQEVDQ
jgi:hypothetical protein